MKDQRRSDKKNRMAREWKIISDSEIGINLVSLRDTETGITVSTPVAKMGGKIEAKAAWTAARFSRSADGVEKILHEIHESGVNAEQKLADFFIKYGHASVADMAIPMVYVNDVPIHMAATHFYTTRVNAGQERSTRFQDFSRSVLPDPSLPSNLREKYDALGQLSISNYLKWTQRLTEKYTEFYKPQPNSKPEQSALSARVFDSSRAFLLAGMNTSFADRTSAREWARLIALGKGGRSRIDQQIANQIEELLAPETEISGYVPEVSSLIRHTEANETIGRKFVALKRFFRDNFGLGLLTEVDRKFGSEINQVVNVLPKDVLVGEKMAVQYLLSLHPNINFRKGLELVRSLTPDRQNELSRLMFGEQSHINVMGNQAEVTGITSELTMAFSEARDMNRHRGQGRFAPWFEVREGFTRLFDKGFILPLYLSEVGEFKSEKTEFVDDMERYFAKLMTFANDFDGDSSLFLNLFPLAGAITYFMHADPKQESYITNLRSRPGGHINYRRLAWERANEVAKLDPLLAGILLNSKRPDPASRDEFFNRT